MVKSEIILADCLDWMKWQAENSMDFIVTDPPYGLKFMGKEWDHGLPGVEYWEEALRICKPASMLASFGGTRTFHRLASAIEDSGWEIRDCIMWVYGSGFPKSHNNFGLEGYGTSLKPSYEPIILAMKPLDGTYKANAEKWGLGGINIDASRIETKENLGRNNLKQDGISPFGVKDNSSFGNGKSSLFDKPIIEQGRWPANLILDEEAGKLLDEQSGNSASRFFYCAKASKNERNAGLDTPCSHPTVKPLSLMRYIIKLLAPPGNPILLDPFAGSGSTIVAAKELGINAIGIEKNEEYVEIARKRVGL